MGELGGIIEWPTQMGEILGAVLVNLVRYTLLAKVFPKSEICHNPANGTNNTK
jgi:hypothetical protein